MKGHERVLIGLKGIAERSWVELNLPVDAVVRSLWYLAGGGAGDSASLSIEEFFGTGEGVKITLERVPKAKEGP